MKYIRRERRSILNPDIGLAPLIDTAFTLLIVFMVAAPAIQHAIKVDLPRGDIKEAEGTNPDLVVSVDKKGTIFFNNRPVTLDTLASAVRLKVSPAMQKKGVSVWLRVNGATTTVNTCTEIMSCLRKVDGIKDVKIETEPARTAHAA